MAITDWLSHLTPEQREDLDRLVAHRIEKETAPLILRAAAGAKRGVTIRLNRTDARVGDLGQKVEALAEKVAGFQEEAAGAFVHRDELRNFQDETLRVAVQTIEKRGFISLKPEEKEAFAQLVGEKVVAKQKAAAQEKEQEHRRAVAEQHFLANLPRWQLYLAAGALVIPTLIALSTLGVEIWSVGHHLCTIHC